ncbi:MAG: polysaccharide deacetylase family protein [Chlorobi bacterium]|nr:polysaccharide deacetylase family protein [Chlorobiota bacterium]
MENSLSIKYFVGLWLIPWWIFSQGKFDARITPFKDGKPGAVSISFDDGTWTQFAYAFPLLEKYGMKATFSVVGEWVKEEPSYSAEPGMFQIKKMGWAQVRVLARHGHEIAAHGYRHRKYPPRARTDSLAARMRKIKKLIENRIGKPVITLHYPYSFTSDSIRKAARKAGFLLARTGTYKGLWFNDYQNFDPWHLKSVAFLNDTLPSPDSLKSLLKSARGKWIILMYHHFFPPGSKEEGILTYHGVTHTYSVHPSTFARHLELLTASPYWIAPEAETGKYMYERLHTRIRTRRFFGRYMIRLRTDLDLSRYDYPLTLEIRVPWKYVRIKGSLKDGTYSVEGPLLISVRPGGKVIVRRIRKRT